MKKTNHLLSALSIGCCIALLFLALQREWIIVQLPSWKTTQDNTAHSCMKQSVKLFWHQDRWASEPVEIIASQTNPAHTVKNLIDRWLTWLDEERLTDRKISLQSALATPDGTTIMLSFDRSPFGTENSTAQKLSWVESLLKTIRDNGIKIQQVRFLVHHQELQDYHLDFSNSWPIIGFGNKS
jgi:hypothetical protein